MNDDAQIQRYHVFVYSDMNAQGGMNDYKGQIIAHKCLEDTREKLTDHLCRTINAYRWVCNNGFGHIYTIDCSEQMIKRATFKCVGIFANGTVSYFVEDLQWEESSDNH